MRRRGKINGSNQLLFVIGILLIVAGSCGGDSPGPGQPLDNDAVDQPDDATSPDQVPDETPSDTDPQPDTTGVDRSAELIGRWEITEYELADGGFTNIVGDQPVFIEFNADGSVDYHTGCNQGTSAFASDGTYAVPTSALDDTVEGQPIRIGPSSQTEIGCDGFLGDQDVDLPAQFAATTRFILDGDALRLLDEFRLVEATRGS